MATPPPQPQPQPQPQGLRQPPSPKPGGGPPQMARPAPQPLPAGAAPAPMDAPMDDAAVVQLSFFQLPWVQNVLPFVTSLTLHATLLVVAVLVMETVKMIKAPPVEEQVIIPDSTMAEQGPPGGVPNVGLGGDPFKQAAQDKVADAGTPDGWAEKKGPSVDISSAGGGSGDSTDSVISVGPGGGFGKGKGLGSGSGDGHGSGNGDGGGPLAMFGTPGGGGIGPKGPVFGHGGNARLITFVCDASGSMINKMPSLKNELGKAVQGLRNMQQFGVVFFQDEKPQMLATQLLPATPENKRKAEKFLEDITTTGTTNPIPGVEKAFAQHPQLLYLLTDGDFPDNKAVLARIRELNKDHKVKVNTIAFTSATDTDTEFLTLLQQIAKENGGVFKAVKEESLN